MADLTCIVVTPELTVCEKPADFVAVTLFDGELGILPSHTPLVGRLGYGELRIRNGNQVERFYVEGGFVEVAGDVVTLLTPRAVPANKIDEQAVIQQMEAARTQPARTPELMAARQQAVDKGRAQVRVAQRGSDQRDEG